jgi:oligopeptide/dipeptide ABC transporter ATP-binding protein
MVFAMSSIQGFGDSFLEENDSILQINNVKLDFHTYAGEVKALDGVTFSIKKGEAVGLVGESGCGKSVTALTIVGLLPENAIVTQGEVLFAGRNLLTATKDEKRKLRATQIAMVFQDPTTFLNPVLTIGEQLEEVYLLDRAALARAASGNQSVHTKRGHRKKLSKRQERETARALSINVLKRVGLADPDRVLKQYPHELSGGMRQRCMIAMALARNPALLIADEITTALDVTIQAQILELLRDLKRDFRGSTLLITHDLGVIAELCDRVAVMYAGNVVEFAAVTELFANPLHPYTQGLMRAIPMLGAKAKRLKTIPGAVPDLINPPSGCRFHNRCPYVLEKCKSLKPLLLNIGDNHMVACHLYVEGP